MRHENVSFLLTGKHTSCGRISKERESRALYPLSPMLLDIITKLFCFQVLQSALQRSSIVQGIELETILVKGRYHFIIWRQLYPAFWLKCFCRFKVVPLKPCDPFENSSIILWLRPLQQNFLRYVIVNFVSEIPEIGLELGLYSCACGLLSHDTHTVLLPKSWNSMHYCAGRRSKQNTLSYNYFLFTSCTL